MTVSDLERRLDDIARNDPDEAEVIARAFAEVLGYCPSAIVHYLVMLQDDGAAFRGRLRGVDIRPRPGEAEAR